MALLPSLSALVVLAARSACVPTRVWAQHQQPAGLVATDLPRRRRPTLGKTRHTSGVKPLLGLLKHKDAEIQAAAAEALGNYAELELKERKKVFEELLKLMMGEKAKADADVTDQIAQQRWQIIVGPIVTTLQLLAKHEETNPEEWQRWFGDEAPLGQETVMPVSHRRAGFRVSIGAIASQ